MRKWPSLLATISLALASSVLYTPIASPQAGKFILQSLDDILRSGSRIAPSLLNRTYRIINTSRTGIGAVVTTVMTANGAYQIYVDCKQGLVSRDIHALPQEQRASLVRDICRGQFR